MLISNCEIVQNVFLSFHSISHPLSFTGSISIICSCVFYHFYFGFVASFIFVAFVTSIRWLQHDAFKQEKIPISHRLLSWTECGMAWKRLDECIPFGTINISLMARVADESKKVDEEWMPVFWENVNHSTAIQCSCTVSRKSNKKIWKMKGKNTIWIYP